MQAFRCNAPLAIRPRSRTRYQNTAQLRRIWPRWIQINRLLVLGFSRLAACPVLPSSCQPCAQNTCHRMSCTLLQLLQCWAQLCQNPNRNPSCTNVNVRLVLRGPWYLVAAVPSVQSSFSTSHFASLNPQPQTFQSPTHHPKAPTCKPYKLLRPIYLSNTTLKQQQTQRHTHTQTHTHTNTHTDKHTHTHKHTNQQEHIPKPIILKHRVQQQVGLSILIILL